MIAATLIGGVIGLVLLPRFAASRRLRFAALAWAALLVVLAPDQLQLAMTIVIEAAVVLAFAIGLGIDGFRTVIVSAFANAVTQPTLYVLLPRLPSAGGEHYWLALAVAEATVWLVEGFIYSVCLPDLWRGAHALRTAFLISFAANAASAALGLALPW